MNYNLLKVLLKSNWHSLLIFFHCSYLPSVLVWFGAGSTLPPWMIVLYTALWLVEVVGRSPASWLGGNIQSPVVCLKQSVKINFIKTKKINFLIVLYLIYMMKKHIWITLVNKMKILAFSRGCLRWNEIKLINIMTFNYINVININETWGYWC